MKYLYILENVRFKIECGRYFKLLKEKTIENEFIYCLKNCDYPILFGQYINSKKRHSSIVTASFLKKPLATFKFQAGLTRNLPDYPYCQHRGPVLLWDYPMGNTVISE